MQESALDSAKAMSARDDDWFEAEQPMRTALVSELRRLARRARPRWLPILVIASALTGLILWRQATKVRVHRAQIVLAVTEGALADGLHPMPVHELRDYILTVLLSDDVLAEIIEDRELFALRTSHGMAYALAELRDMFEVGVHRNFFLYSYDVDAPRSARIMIRFHHTDPQLAWELVNELAGRIVTGEHARRLAAAEALAHDAEAALARVRQRAATLEAALIDRAVVAAGAEAAGAPGGAAALRVEIGELSAQLHREHERILTLTQLASADEQAGAIDRAGLGLHFVVAQERQPIDEPGARLYLQVILGAVLFCALLPMVAVYVGAFDARVHDAEDVERIGLPVLGHLPGFPGDDVGSLRARGVRGRRVAS
jgi:hypothetical protein